MTYPTARRRSDRTPGGCRRPRGRPQGLVSRTSGIRVNTVAPGIIRTPMHAEETHDALAALHPVGRIGDTSDIVEAIAYLETAEFVTGEILHVDGGQSAGH
jgi:NAD(P)-dependent dehydrogenase (short-subunit alcohol dehydrogenase family)